MDCESRKSSQERNEKRNERESQRVHLNLVGMQVEPFNRALVESEADVMINGRRQDHGFERAQLEVGPIHN
jgi:3'-phosphoadenosine 5'-phosphosulfate sulfotransferase (PAPS reductase)/FAD synthetase